MRIIYPDISYFFAYGVHLFYLLFFFFRDYRLFHRRPPFVSVLSRRVRGASRGVHGIVNTSYLRYILEQTHERRFARRLQHRKYFVFTIYFTRVASVTDVTLWSYIISSLTFFRAFHLMLQYLLRTASGISGI